jgi:hypothetical protein
MPGGKEIFRDEHAAGCHKRLKVGILNSQLLVRAPVCLAQAAHMDWVCDMACPMKEWAFTGRIRP